MPIIPPRKTSLLKTKPFATGHRACVKRIAGPGILRHSVGRFSHSKPLRTADDVKRMFYKFKFGTLFYPNNFPKVRAAWKTGTKYGDLLISQLSALSFEERTLWRIITQESKRTGDTYSVPVVFKTQEWLKHEARVEKEALPLAKIMRKKGIHVDTHPVNIWFDKKGNPIFFDVMELEPPKLTEAKTNKKAHHLFQRVINNGVMDAVAYRF